MIASYDDGVGKFLMMIIALANPEMMHPMVVSTMRNFWMPSLWERKPKKKAFSYKTIEFFKIRKRQLSVVVMILLLLLLLHKLGGRRHHCYLFRFFPHTLLIDQLVDTVFAALSYGSLVGCRY